ncbi:MAG: GNAT family N-acetyltransferase [Actinomycetes bacterium]
MRVGVRVVSEDDLDTLTELAVANREFLAPWEPRRDEAYYTREHQAELLGAVLRQHAARTALPGAITLDGAIVGRVNVFNIVRGPFCSGDLGYWVDRAHVGRGIGTAAVGAIARLAFREFGLHRLQAGTLVHNAGSQRVLQRNGFTRIGLAPGYLQIDGRWQDHILFQLIDESPCRW